MPSEPFAVLVRASAVGVAVHSFCQAYSHGQKWIGIPFVQLGHRLIDLLVPDSCTPPPMQGMEASYADLAAQLDGTSVTVAKYQADTDREFCTEKLGLKTFPTIIYLPKGREGFIKYPSERRDVDTLKM